MNKERRKEIERIVDELEDLRDRLNYVADEERDAFENMPESIQDSERGREMEEYADRLESAYDNLDSVIGDLQEILES